MNVALAASSALGRCPTSWAPVVGGFGGLVRLDDTGGGVERDAGVCMPLSLGETEADEESLFMDDEGAWVTCVSPFGMPRSTGEMDPAKGLSSTGIPWSGFSARRVSPTDVERVG